MNQALTWLADLLTRLHGADRALEIAICAAVALVGAWLIYRAITRRAALAAGTMMTVRVVYTEDRSWRLPIFR